MGGVLGIDIQTDDKRYHAHFAVVDSGTLTFSSSHHAPAGEDESVQLAELRLRAMEIIDQHEPDSAAIKALETGGRSLKLADASPKIRAAGAVLSAVGDRNVACEDVSGPTLRAALGTKCSTADAVGHLCGQIAGTPAAGCEAAAAVAQLVDSRP